MCVCRVNDPCSYYTKVYTLKWTALKPYRHVRGQTSASPTCHKNVLTQARDLSQIAAIILLAFSVLLLALLFSITIECVVGLQVAKRALGYVCDHTTFPLPSGICVCDRTTIPLPPMASVCVTTQLSLSPKVSVCVAAPLFLSPKVSVCVWLHHCSSSSNGICVTLQLFLFLQRRLCDRTPVPPSSGTCCCAQALRVGSCVKTCLKTWCVSGSHVLTVHEDLGRFNCHDSSYVGGMCRT